ncbi:hypothetical protein [Leptospira kanakyensis]|uniref:Uncharacterized protein n=1 Tax=Leptospira kanakyensis TaxID=2484968 RepID=A0A6N4Q980_9LEPT|nr:hypothetical protein [Leptospira kanakyensis]MCW7482512.1 hypothetical protein [Leptospira kanakyensis]TGK49399.1 hypothetical protein EHQ11_15360 [Leptospira kanakyensis]TGK60361.1 hypothetical protein EHQ16_09830 [Leptospira kanakyensis]TGK67760.1 hypothetical protein EHQ18_14630 [Leptospira kanakyensis]
MKGNFWILVLLGISTSSILSQTLVEPNQNFVWENFSFVFPEAVVVKQNSTMSKKLTVYPAKRDGFFMVVRTLPWKEGLEDKTTWKDSVFTKGIEPKQFQKAVGNLNFQIFQADQVRNQNALRNQVWVSIDSSPSLWIWIQWKSDRKDLTEFFESNRFLPL